VNVLEINNIDFSWEEKKILTDFNLSLKQGEIHCLLGDSGCGKSTLLHLIAGFLSPESGEIVMNGKTISGPSDFLAPEKRKIGIVFQEHCLFPHMTIEKNVAYGVPSQSSTVVDESLSLVRLSHKKSSFPDQLSGGEQQRVAIARSLAASPELFLMDEPFSSLDQTLRETLRKEIRTILKEKNLTTIMVTHSVEEALEFCDRLTLFSQDGSTITGTATEILERAEFADLKKSLISRAEFIGNLMG